MEITMKSRSTGNLTGLAIVALAGIGGLVSYCYITPDCLFASTRQSTGFQKSKSPEKSLTSQKSRSPQKSKRSQTTKGEKPMSTVIQNAVVHADEKTFRKVVLNSEVPVLVDFYADWCGPCRALGPVLEELAQETPNAKIVKVNVDDSPQLAGQYGVSSIPNLLVFKDGRIVDQQVGLASKQQLKALLVE
jgi:thioredoxin 1